MLSTQKKIGIAMVLTGSVLLLVLLLSIPLQMARTTQIVLAVCCGALFLCAMPLMWRDGIARLRANTVKRNPWLEIRQSGFFDLIKLFVLLAVILGVLCAVGALSYRSTLNRHVALADPTATAATLEEALLLEGFVDFNFKQDLNILSKNYKAFGMVALVLLAISAVCFLYIWFVSPIVRADESLSMAHGVYRTVGQYAMAIFVVLIMLFPIYWMIISSFKTSTELLAPVPTLWPQEFVWENYPNVLKRAPFGRYLLNTLVTTLFITLGELTIGVLAAYGFSKGQFKGRNTLFMLVLGALMVPIQVTFVPIYVMIARLNAIDTYLGIILPNLVSAYFIFMLRQNFMAVDDSYIDAGRVDGMGRIGTIVNVLVPMCKPTVITVTIISFINGWNSYFWPKMVTKTEASRTIAVGVQQLKNTFAGQEVSNYNEIMAGAVMAIVPIIALFLVLQKYIMTGMSKASMK